MRDIEEQVDWFCNLWSGHRPRTKDVCEIPQKWLRSGEAAAKPFDGGHFWGCIKENFLDDGKRSITALNEACRVRVRALPWAQAELQKLQKKRDEVKVYQATVEERVGLLCKLWPGDTGPRVKDTHKIAQEWLRSGKATTKHFEIGMFWRDIKYNFLGNGRGAGTMLNDACRARVRALPWMQVALQKLQTKMEKRVKVLVTADAWRFRPA